jgi:hypothetical protein
MHLEVSAEDLRPIVAAAVAEVLAQVAETDARLGKRLGYPEAEAAELLGIAPHVLRDARLRGEISARKIGRGYIYERTSLVAFLRGRD